MNPVTALLKAWRARRRQLAFDQIKNPVQDASHPKRGALGGLTQAKSRTDWSGD